MEKKYMGFEDLDCYKLAFNLSNYVWGIVVTWNYFSQNTVGIQLVRSIDSVSANIAEGFGRYSKKDKIRFYRISRGSLLESKDWIEKAKTRELLTIEQYNNINHYISKLPFLINQLIKYTQTKLKE